MRAFTREDLAAATCDCGRPGCDGTASRLSPVCHPEAGFRLVFDRKTSTLAFACHKCRRALSGVVVASASAAPQQVLQ